MEPASMITGALVSAAAVAAKGVGTQAINDGYRALKSAIQTIFQEKCNPEGQIALSKLEENPEVWEAPLKSVLRETEAEKDQFVLENARQLIESVKDSPEAQHVLSKYNLSESQVGVIGDNTTVKGGIHFNKSEK